MNFPNRLTVFRVLLIPVLVLVYIFPYSQLGINLGYLSFSFVSIPVKYLIILVIFVVASLTDFFDGYIARKYNLVTTFGKFMDPIADKLLINTLFIILACDGVMPFVPVLIMIWRDTFVDAIRMMASNKGKVISAGLLGKLKTNLQIYTIVMYLICNFPFEIWHLPVNTFLLWLSTLVSIAGGISYFIQAKNIILESK